ncbi:hypothetical protein Tco_0613155 [Tanacetum coccineum]
MINPFELNQHDDVHVVPEPVLVDEDEDLEEDEFEEEEEDNNNESTSIGMRPVPASVHEVGESSTTPFLREDSDGLLPGLMRRDINSLFGWMVSLSR